MLAYNKYMLLFVSVKILSCWADELKWWQTSIVYQIYPRSFQDSDGDGIGDIQGIISRLDYLKSLHIGAVWLSPVYTSPMADFGYDVADYMDIDPIFGTMEDMEELIDEIHKRDMKIIMDYIPNHTSDQHPWFLESKKGGEENPYRDYYRWHDGQVLENGSRVPPNNWVSIFGGPAWTWVEERNQYYLHQFTLEQPDLDYRQPEVVEKMKNVLQFWLKKDIDGFRVDAILTLFEVEDLNKDEPRSYLENVSPHQHEYLEHIHTLHQSELHHVVRGWADLIEEYQHNSGKEIFMVMEVFDETMEHAMIYYDSGADMPFNFGLLFINSTCGGTCFKNIISGWMRMMPKDKWPNFVIGNHDLRRISSRKGKDNVNALNMLLLTLPGTPTTYYGEEIGMLDIPLPSWEDTIDPAGKNMGPELYSKYSRDPARSPMQWNSEENAGFSSAHKTWLPVHDNYHVLNVQEQQKTQMSSLHIYQTLSLLRKMPAFCNSNIIFHKVNQEILSYIRRVDGTDIYLVILNLGNKEETDTYNFKISENGPIIDKGEVMVNTGNFAPGLYTPAQIVYLTGIQLKPGQGLVIRTGLSHEYKQSNDEL